METVTFEEIQKANEGLTAVSIRGREYIVVPQRVKAFRKLYPQGFIITKIISNEGGVCVMQARAGYYDPDSGDPVILGTGYAFERQDAGNINKTSYIENCETSAIGRALGFLGLGIDASIASAEEMVNAISGQEDQPAAAPEAQPAAAPRTAKGKAYDEKTPSGYLMNEKIRLERTIPLFNFKQARDRLIEAGKVENIPSVTMTMEQARELVAAIRAEYPETNKKERETHE